MGSRAPIVAVVDDDKIFQFTASKIIKDSSITDQVLQFGDGEQALRFLRSNHQDKAALPDVIFLDINMPMVDGWMFLDDFDGLKGSLAKPITIYMVSSSIDPSDISRAERNSNVRAYLIKPVTRDKFLEILSRAA